MKDFTPVNDFIAGALRDALKCDCQFCLMKPINQDLANRALEAFQRRLVAKKDCDPRAIHALKMLVRAEDGPIPGEVFERVIGIDTRARKQVMRDLRDEWLLPVSGTRQRPFGYFIASTLEQLLEWGRVTRSQAISELAVWYRVYRVNAPELAGQEPLDFVQAVSTELQEAIR